MIIRTVHDVTGHSHTTITDWFNYARTTCGAIMDHQPKLVGTAEKPVKIDVTYMSGRRKYRRGRLLAGDHPDNSDAINEEAELPDWNEITPDDNGGADDNSEDHVRFGEDDPTWRGVVGIWQSNSQVRFIRVPNRAKRTLNAVISQHVESGNHITTDMWAGYNDLNNLVCVHTTVNHSENYIDPDTGAHPQEIEVAWNNVKESYKRMRGNRELL